MINEFSAEDKSDEAMIDVLVDIRDALRAAKAPTATVEVVPAAPVVIPAPIVTVAAAEPSIVPAPTVTVEAPVVPPPVKTAWVFTITRDDFGFFKTVVATPQ